MNVAYDRIECLKLRELYILSTHDSGMYTANNLRAPSIEASVATQTRVIEEQLEAGARFLDLRPAFVKGAWVTGHHD
jgi:hypothetical protein